MFSFCTHFDKVGLEKISWFLPTHFSVLLQRRLEDPDGPFISMSPHYHRNVKLDRKMAPGRIMATKAQG